MTLFDQMLKNKFSIALCFKFYVTSPILVKKQNLRLFMRVDIWSDIVCPFCYIGKKRLEAAAEKSRCRIRSALAQF